MKLKKISIQSKPKQIKENPEGTESKMKQQKDLFKFCISVLISLKSTSIFFCHIVI